MWTLLTTAMKSFELKSYICLTLISKLNGIHFDKKTKIKQTKNVNNLFRYTGLYLRMSILINIHALKTILPSFIFLIASLFAFQQSTTVFTYRQSLKRETT